MVGRSKILAKLHRALALLNRFEQGATSSAVQYGGRSQAANNAPGEPFGSPLKASASSGDAFTITSTTVPSGSPTEWASSTRLPRIMPLYVMMGIPLQ